MKQIIYLLVGLIGSGKSTWSKKKVREEEDTVIICKDNFREMLRGKYVFDFKYEDTVKSLMKFGLRKALQNGFNVIIDETNITRKKRAELINKIKIINGWCYDNLKLVILYFPDNNNCIENRMTNPRGISREQWEDVYNNMKKQFEKPSYGELKIDGEIFEISVDDCGNYKYYDMIGK